MISSETPKNWLESRLPYAGALRAHFTAPLWLREKPYLGILPVLITAALIFMALTGFVLSLSYNPADAYHSIQFIDRNVNYGWLIHAFHETGTTMIFGAVYLFLFRAIYDRSYKAPGELLWLLSVTQFSLLLLVGYLGYVLADGAVSYWSVTNSISGANGLNGFPGAIGVWFFGGPSGAGTLARLAVFHVAGALAIFGIVALYNAAKNAVVPAPGGRNQIAFHPYYTSQYFVAFVVFALIFAILVFFAPHLGENPLNRNAASPLLVPLTVTPPWYLLGLASIGQIVPGGLGNIVAVLAGLAVLFALPWLDRSRPGAQHGGLYRFLVVVLALDVILLSLAAAHQPSMLASILVVVFTVYYFLHFIVLTPLVTAMETK